MADLPTYDDALRRAATAAVQADEFSCAGRTGEDVTAAATRSLAWTALADQLITHDIYSRSTSGA